MSATIAMENDGAVECVKVGSAPSNFRGLGVSEEKCTSNSSEEHSMEKGSQTIHSLQPNHLNKQSTQSSRQITLYNAQHKHVSHDMNQKMEPNLPMQHNLHPNVQILSLQQNHQHVAAIRSAHILHTCSSSSSLAKPSEQQKQLNGFGLHENGGGARPENNGEGFNREMRALEDLLSKLNPMAKEFVPPSLANHALIHNSNTNYINGSSAINNNGNNNNNSDNNDNRRRKNNYQGKRRMNSRTSIAQREDSIRRTVYVSDIDQQVTEEQLAALFINCGQVVDCRVCGDPNSVLRFAFVEFVDEEGARAALSLAGTMLGYYPVRVLPSKTAIAPVNPTFLPRSEDEREMCARTIYCTNIDKKVSQAEVKLFFESLCGEVSRLRLLGDYHHSTRIAFVEFVMAESAIAALNCSGAILGSLPIRVSPSKTPVRPRTSRSTMH